MPISQPRILNETLSRKAAIATGTATIVKNISKIKNEIVNIIVTLTCPLSPKYKFKVTQAGADCQPSCFYYPRHNIRPHHDIVPADLQIADLLGKIVEAVQQKAHPDRNRQWCRPQSSPAHFLDHDPQKNHEKGIEHKEAVAAESLLLKLVIGRYNREHHDNADNEINVVITALMIVAILVKRKGLAGSNWRKLEENIPRQQYCQQAVILWMPHPNMNNEVA